MNSRNKSWEKKSMDKVTLFPIPGPASPSLAALTVREKKEKKSLFATLANRPRASSAANSMQLDDRHREFKYCFPFSFLIMTDHVMQIWCCCVTELSERSERKESQSETMHSFGSRRLMKCNLTSRSNQRNTHTHGNHVTKVL